MSGMRAPGAVARYSGVAQTLHWLTVLCVGAAYVLSEGGSESRVYAPERASTLSLHETFGITVLVLVVLRLLWRVVRQPPAEPAMAAWMHTTSRLVRWALYLLLFAVPLTAVAGSWLEGHSLVFVGIGPVAPPMATSRVLGESIIGVHPLLGNLIIWIASLHAAAALFHHFVLRDGVLLSMLPGGKA